MPNYIIGADGQHYPYGGGYVGAPLQPDETQVLLDALMESSGIGLYNIAGWEDGEGGDGWGEEVGAPMMRMPFGRAMMPQRQAPYRAPARPIPQYRPMPAPYARPPTIVNVPAAVPGKFDLKETQPIKQGSQPLPFDSVTDVAAGATVPITQRVERIFRCTALIIDSLIASSFLINNILVGADSVLSGVGAMPASAFLPEARTRLSFRTAQIGQSITLQVTNRSGGPLRFTAAMFGDAAS